MARKRRRRQREEAKARRAALIERLGGKCVECRTVGTRRNPLEVDHPDGRDYDIRKMDSAARVARYEDEERRGVRLEVRCRQHNANAHKVFS